MKLATAVAGSILVLLASWIVADENMGGAPAVESRRQSTRVAGNAVWIEGEGAEPGVVLASSLQPQPQLTPSTTATPAVQSTRSGNDLLTGIFSSGDVARSLLGNRTTADLRQAGNDVVSGNEARTRSPTDAGSMLAKSPTALGVAAQRRTPIVNDPRVRGNRIGRLPASGSYWIPARIDLDTALNKIDSSLIENMIVFKGPYSTQYGPEFSIVDFDLIDTPRYERSEWQGRDSIDYKTNGRQLHARQSFQGGGSNWGVRAGYGQRLGNDYTTGAGSKIPSSYNSGEGDLGLGFDLTEDDRIEFNLLRLDQSNVEFPGYLFDINYLVSDAYELEYVSKNSQYYDRATLDVWYNNTRFKGDAQRPGKRSQFPFLDGIGYTGFTDVSSSSTGYRAAWAWDFGEHSFIAGQDFRFVSQRITELSSGLIGFNQFTNANSPLPRSFIANPGLFIEDVSQVTENWRMRSGARVDIAAADVTENAGALQALGISQPQSSLDAILGSGQYQRSYTLLGGYIASEHKINENTTFTISGGHAERAPNLTELYVAQTFMFVLQNGVNTVTGDPRLRNEKLWQLDLSLNWKFDQVRAGFGGYQAWIQDYITFELFGQGLFNQRQLKYVNTDLATLTGFEGYLERDLNRWVTLFGTLAYVEGRDRTRNGSFATQQADGGNPSIRDPNQVRGFYGGVGGGASEPLPSIVPIESKLGIRLHDAQAKPDWSMEFLARLVGSQNRVATSLLETPTTGFVVFDFRSQWQLTERWQANLGVENLGNRFYREHLDFRSPNSPGVFQPGINFYLGSSLVY